MGDFTFLIEILYLLPVFYGLILDSFTIIRLALYKYNII